MAQKAAVIARFAGAVIRTLTTVIRAPKTAPGNAEVVSRQKPSTTEAPKNIGPDATFYANLGLILEKYEYLSSRNKIIHPQNNNGKT